MTRTSIPRLRSVRLKVGGAQLRVLRGGQDPAVVRADTLSSAAELVDLLGSRLRGYLLAVYDHDGCFTVHYSIDGQTLPFWAAPGAVKEAIDRAMAKSK